MMVKFRYNDLAAASVHKKPGYLDEVMRSARRRGSDVIMTYDAYMYIKDKYRVLVPAGPVQAPACCGKGASARKKVT